VETKVVNEVGFEEALYGLSLSFKDRASLFKDWWNDERFEKMKKTSKALANREGGHNKFLESMVVYIEIEAPRYWWSEFDTYRVGTTKQSESTMHTLSKRDVTQEDFEVALHQPLLDAVNIERHNGVEAVKSVLPESYLQRRLVVTNYKVLRNIIYQRHDHKLPQWRDFINVIYDEVKHPEYLPDLSVL